MSYVQLIYVSGEDRDDMMTMGTRDLNDLKSGQQLSLDLKALVNSNEFRSSGGVSRLHLDFKEVTMISSAALNVLIRLNRQTRDRGIQLVLMDVHQSVREVFTVTRLERMFEFDSSAASTVS